MTEWIPIIIIALIVIAALPWLIGFGMWWWETLTDTIAELRPVRTMMSANVREARDAGLYKGPK